MIDRDLQIGRKRKESSDIKEGIRKGKSGAKSKERQNVIPLVKDREIER